jgi:hypothetical protein
LEGGAPSTPELGVAAGGVVPWSDELMWKPEGRKHHLHLKLRGASPKGGIAISGKTLIQKPRWAATHGCAGLPPGRDSPVPLGTMKDALSAQRAQLVAAHRVELSRVETLKAEARDAKNNRAQLKRLKDQELEDMEKAGAAEIAAITSGFSSELSAAEAEIKGHMKKLKTKDEMIDRRDVKIKTRDVTIKELEILLQKTNEELEQTVEASTHTIESLQADVAEREHAIAFRDAALGELQQRFDRDKGEFENQLSKLDDDKCNCKPPGSSSSTNALRSAIPSAVSVVGGGGDRSTIAPPLSYATWLQMPPASPAQPWQRGWPAVLGGMGRRARWRPRP